MKLAAICLSASIVTVYHVITERRLAAAVNAPVRTCEAQMALAFPYERWCKAGQDRRTHGEAAAKAAAIKRL
jgi:hypothetical protein